MCVGGYEVNVTQRRVGGSCVIHSNIFNILILFLLKRNTVSSEKRISYCKVRFVQIRFFIFSFT